MTSGTFRTEERAGLLVALGLHVLVVAALLLQPDTREPVLTPERMTVSLAEDVGLSATAPDPVAESRAAQAPVLDDNPAISPPEERPVAQPVERPVTRVQPPVPVPSAAARPDTRPRRRPDPPRTTTPPKPKPAPKAGGSRVGDNFLAGAGESATTSETRTPASQIGASAKASIGQAVARQIKPHWSPPNGQDVERIVSFVKFRLNADGSLAGKPQVVRQTGVNATNSAQAGRHGEQAVRAVQLAAPFDLPGEYYEAWKVITANLDWKLAQ
ncbi:energy transducer TonB [Qipengyuania marisflavi]|nr:energy transducer TonB [Qipengyuania marisflavi]